MATDLKQDRNVDADMERAFGVGPRASATPVRPTGTPKPPSPVMPAAPRPPRRWLLIAAPALVALFVLGLAVHFALTLVPDNSTAPAAPPATPKAYSASAPAPAPTATATAATPILPPDDFGPAPIDTPPAAPPTPLPPSPRARPARVAPAPRAAVDCPPGSHEDRCIFADVLAADRRLRGAYARATRAGVPTDDMVAIRRRWTRARAISLKSPDETIRRYEDLADALDDLVETEQR